MLNILISRYPQLDSCKKEIALAVNKIIECYHKSGKLSREMRKISHMLSCHTRLSSHIG